MRPCPRPDARCHGWSIPCGWSHCLPEPEPERQMRVQMQEVSARLQAQEPALAAMQALVSEQV